MLVDGTFHSQRPRQSSLISDSYVLQVFGTFSSVYDIRRLSTDREVEDGDDDQIVRSSAYFDTDPVNSNRPLIGPRLQTVML